MDAELLRRLLIFRLVPTRSENFRSRIEERHEKLKTGTLEVASS